VSATLTHAAWCVQTRHERLCPEWETSDLCATLDDARQWAEAHRGDGYQARVRKWCVECKSYQPNYLRDRCAKCEEIESAKLIR